ncbi:glucose-6-phosphate isomerase [Anaerolineae bacterium CFX9]|nr:glucose-6-phosphate isomerase [Anaerolineae bacterium CFX9]
MKAYMTPFVTQIDMPTGMITDAPIVQHRNLSDMRGFYADADAEEALSGANPLIYSVYYGWNAPEVEGQLGYCTTVIYPGKVGGEYFMTKGHYHAKADRAEIYTGLSGTGLLIMMTPEGKVETCEMRAGTIAYVPPYWAHRTINVGGDNFSFFAVFPADAGYDYGTIAREGFAEIVVERNGSPARAANPNFRRGG